MQVLKWESQPTLRNPVLIAAFEGWNDAGLAASGAAHYLDKTWNAREFASLDPEEFYDFTATRPQVRLTDGVTRHIDWPKNTFTAGAIAGTNRDVVFVHGSEPQLRWRTFCDAILEVATTLGTETVLTLGALVAEVAHTRPISIMGSAADPDFAEQLDLSKSRYEGPTGIVGVLHDACSKAGLRSASLWAAVPHYVSQNSSPKATLALVERTLTLVDGTADLTHLKEESEAYETQINELISIDPDMVDYVRRLEESHQESVETGDVDAIIAEAEKFLREQKEH